MALDHLQALADYIKRENVSHISVHFFLNIKLRWNSHCGQSLRSEKTYFVLLVYALCMWYSDLYKHDNSVEAWQWLND